MIKNSIVKKIVLSFCAFCFLASVLTCPAEAQRRRRGNKPVPRNPEISEENLPWKGWPWLCAILLSAGIMTVGFKDARRTSKD